MCWKPHTWRVFTAFNQQKFFVIVIEESTALVHCRYFHYARRVVNRTGRKKLQRMCCTLAFCNSRVVAQLSCNFSYHDPGERAVAKTLESSKLTQLSLAPHFRARISLRQL